MRLSQSARNVKHTRGSTTCGLRKVWGIVANEDLVSGQLNNMGVVGYFSGLVSSSLAAANMAEPSRPTTATLKRLL